MPRDSRRRSFRARGDRHACGWSYLATSDEDISLAQNLAIERLAEATIIYKIDEDVFVSEGFFDSLLAGYLRVRSESEFALGF